MDSEDRIYLMSKRLLRFNLARFILVEAVTVSLIIWLVVAGIVRTQSDLVGGLLMILTGVLAFLILLAFLSLIAVGMFQSIEVDVQARMIRGNVGVGRGRPISFEEAARMELRRTPLLGYAYLEGTLTASTGIIDRKARRYLYIGSRIDDSPWDLAQVLPQPLGRLGSGYVSVPRITVSEGFRLATLRTVRSWWGCQFPDGPTWLESAGPMSGA